MRSRNLGTDAMPVHLLKPPRGHRDLALDWAAVVLAAIVCLLAATAFNRLPYPGAQHYRESISAVLTAPFVPVHPDATAEPQPHTTSDDGTE